MFAVSEVQSWPRIHGQATETGLHDQRREHTACWRGKTIAPCPFLNTSKYKESLKPQNLTPNYRERNVRIKFKQQLTLFCIIKVNNAIPFISLFLSLFIWIQSWTNTKPISPGIFVLNQTFSFWMEERAITIY